MADDFLKLRYPCYWHYDILVGLKVMAEAGFLKDPRCREALDILVSKRLPDGGFPEVLPREAAGGECPFSRRLGRNE